MALTSTIYRVSVALSDVDRGVYESLELRLARHPSETLRYLVTRLFAYCLSYEEGIGFSKGGLSSPDEPPVSIHDPTGALTAWIDVGTPSAERLHKASKACARVSLFSAAELSAVRREASARTIHRVESIALHLLPAKLVDALGERLEKSTSLELVRNEGQLYVTVAGGQLEGALTSPPLLEG